MFFQTLANSQFNFPGHFHTATKAFFEIDLLIARRSLHTSTCKGEYLDMLLIWVLVHRFWRTRCPGALQYVLWFKSSLDTNIYTACISAV